MYDNKLQYTLLGSLPLERMQAEAVVHDQTAEVEFTRRVEAALNFLQFRGDWGKECMPYMHCYGVL